MACGHWGGTLKPGIGRDLGDIGEEGGVPVEPRAWRVRVLNYSVSKIRVQGLVRVAYSVP